MKRTVIVALVLTVFAAALPILTAPADTGMITEAKNTDNEHDPEQKTENEKNDAPLYYEPEKNADSETVIRLLDNGEVSEIPMSEYLYGAVAAEMPASFESEALKAQAVAIRTYLIYKMRVAPSSAHPDADICSASTCCAAWKPDEFLKDKWGDDYEKYSRKIRAAVSETAGEYLTYGGAPVLAVFHSSSSGRTEDAGAVWSNSVPYLVSVESPEGEENVPNYTFSVTVSAQEFADTIKTRYPDADLSGDTEGWIGEVTYTGSGRINTVKIGGTEVSGKALRSLFSLRSTNVKFSVGNGTVTMISTGYGHGVGMSQYGANVMAGDGSDYREILASYYPGTEITDY